MISFGRFCFLYVEFYFSLCKNTYMQKLKIFQLSETLKIYRYFEKTLKKAALFK